MDTDAIISLIKNFLCGAITFILSILAPIEVAVHVLFMFFTINCIMGMWADIQEGFKFSLKKFLGASKELIWYIALIFMLHTAFSRFDKIDTAVFLAQWGTWFFAGSYLINSIRNSLIVFPGSKTLKLLYAIVTFQYKKIINDKFDINLDDYEEKDNR